MATRAIGESTQRDITETLWPPAAAKDDGLPPLLIMLTIVTGVVDALAYLMRLVAHPPANGVCLADLTGAPMIVSLPSQINVHHRLTIRFYYPLTKKPFIATVPPL
jgi:hypothetical protein